ncbi:MAG: alpha/beta hydrolase [Alphaproteobacteria bacterium]|nr:alpha/beta hydrolase [Alphaproteobacteria bacterium]
MTIIASLLAAAALVAPAPAAIQVEAPGPLGPLKGSLMMPSGTPRATVLIIPGSGPTDRDGNNPLGIRAAPYRLLAEGLAAKGIASVRIDKRGMFESKAAVANANAVTVADYAADAHVWAKAIRARTGAPCVWLLGHSEGGLIAMAAAQDPTDICGLILVSAPGRKLGDVLRQQLRASPAFAPDLQPALANIGALEAGKRVDVPQTNPVMMSLFAPQVQGFLISLLSYDPAKLVGAVARPVLIVQGERDLQVSVEDARALAAGDARARLYLVPGANHVLKAVASDDRTANLATYGDPTLPLAPGIVDTIAAFVTEGSTGR